MDILHKAIKSLQDSEKPAITFDQPIRQTYAQKATAEALIDIAETLRYIERHLAQIASKS